MTVASESPHTVQAQNANSELPVADTELKTTDDLLRGFNDDELNTLRRNEIIRELATGSSIRTSRSASLTEKLSAPNDSVVCCGTTTARLRSNPPAHAIHLSPELFNSAPVCRFATRRSADISTAHSLQSTVTSLWRVRDRDVVSGTIPERSAPCPG